jgi:hypothetical protein
MLDCAIPPRAGLLLGIISPALLRLRSPLDRGSYARQAGISTNNLNKVYSVGATHIFSMDVFKVAPFKIFVDQSDKNSLVTSKTSF